MTAVTAAPPGDPAPTAPATSTNPARLRELTGKASGAVGAVGVIVAFFGLWEAIPRLGIVRDTILPPASEALGLVPSLLASDRMRDAIAISGGNWVVGLAAATAIGIVVGVLMASSKLVAAFFNPLLTASYAMPKASLVIILVLWLGVNRTSMSSIVAFSGSVPIAFATYHALLGIDQRLVWGARSLGTHRLRVWSRVALPVVLPAVLSGIRIGFGLSYVAVIGSEFLVRQGGVGSLLFGRMEVGLFTEVWAIGLIIGGIAIVIDLVFLALSRLLVPWYDGEV